MRSIAHGLCVLLITLGSLCAHVAAAPQSRSRPVVVLFEDDDQIVETLSKGEAVLRVETTDVFQGRVALSVTPREKYSEQIRDWRFPIRERPKDGEYRYLRFAWKKVGGGGAMIEVANNRQWPPAKASPPPGGRYIAGPNKTGLDAIAVGSDAPTAWTVVTIDLWKDLGDFPLTGLSLMASDTGQTLFDSIILGADLASLDAYRPNDASRGVPAIKPVAPVEHVGDAWSDPKNPIVEIFGGKRLDLWSLRKPERPELPKVKDARAVRTPVDAFIVARLESNHLSLSPEADRRTLIRRLYIDLIGLPPTPDEVDAFVNDKSPSAYEELVDRLLASPRYGERWARHWLDVVRYADTNGFERDEFRPTQYQYRDYVVRAFNEDKPYDQFVREQLAGDEMLPQGNKPRDRAEVDRLIATGYLRLGPYDTTRAIFDEDRKGHDQLMADLVNTTGEAFLGMTLACANCHDHKYDPISQADHFRMRAFFAAVKFRDDMVIDTAAVQDEINRHNAAIDEKAASLRKQIEDMLAPVKQRLSDERRGAFPADIAELLKTDESKRDEETKKKLKPYLDKLNVSDKDALAALEDADRKQHDTRQGQIGELEKQKREMTTTLGMSDAGPTAPVTHIYAAGDYTKPLDEVSPGFLSVLDPNPAAVTRPARGDTTGRRTALAKRITSPDNPLAARVMVNRIWQHHFGVGLVATPNDFGYSGARPTHPDLLDWLAVEFAQPSDGGTPWSIKRMHRLIVTSATYRQASLDDSSKHAIDPDNKLLWRQNPRRLDAETLRDSMLFVSGALLPTVGGAPVWPEIPDSVKAANPKLVKGEAADGLAGWYTTTPVEQTFVRSLYTIQKRSVRLPMLEAFDQPDPNRSCTGRFVTTVAPQALMLLNSPFAAAMAERFADRVAKDAGDDEGKRIDAVFKLALGRTPDSNERAICANLLRTHTAKHAEAKVDTPAHAALVDLCRSLLNLNEFVYVD